MRKYFLFAILIPLSIWADKASFSTVDNPPWITGPLVAPSAFAIPVGHYYIEPYINMFANTAIYNRDWEPVEIDTFWNNSSQTLIQVGITKWMDFQINPTLFYNYRDGAASWALGDLPLGFDIMPYTRGTKPTDWITAIKFTVKETFPLGKYRNLKPKKRGTDAGGEGSWQTSFGFVWGQIVHVTGKHFFDTRVALFYTLPAPVTVKGFNAYGGGYGTRGTVYPAQVFNADLGMEFTLSQNWALALDVIGNWTGKTRFKGKRGVGLNGLPAVVGSGSSVQYSLAPALEYNWSQQIGIIGGSWFTVAGRNSFQFFSAIVAFSYYH